MALKNKSLILYGFQVTAANSSLDFKVAGGPTLLATLRWGYYTLNSLMAEVIYAMSAQAPAETFSYTIDRSLVGGLENRVSISIATGSIQLLFGTGPRKSSSIATTLGYPTIDLNGGTLTSSTTAGTALLTAREGYNYLSPDFTHRVRGAVNVSASGIKEAIVYEIQQFAQVEYRHEPEAKVITQWKPLMDWLIQQRPIELTPDYTLYSDVIECTLERSAYDGAGLGYQFPEMLPEFPFYYRTNQLTFRRSLGPYAVLNPQGTGGTGGGGGGGGGGGTVINNYAASATTGWYSGPDYPPLEAEENSQFVYLFAPSGGQKLVLDVRIPQEYVAGTQVFMYISQYSQSAAGTQLLQATTYLVRAGVDTAGSTANAHASTNGALTNSVSFQLRTAALDLTDAAGQINALTPAAGDMLRIVLTRGGDTDPTEIRLIPSAANIGFG